MIWFSITTECVHVYPCDLYELTRRQLRNIFIDKILVWTEHHEHLD